MMKVTSLVDVLARGMRNDNKGPLDGATSELVSLCNVARSCNRVKKQRARVDREMEREEREQLELDKHPHKRYACAKCKSFFIGHQWEDGGWPKFCSPDCLFDAVAEVRKRQCSV